LPAIVTVSHLAVVAVPLGINHYKTSNSQALLYTL